MLLALSPLPLAELLPRDTCGCKGGRGGSWNHGDPCKEDWLPGCLWGQCPEDPCPAGQGWGQDWDPSVPSSPSDGQSGQDAVTAHTSPPRQPGTPLALPKCLIKGICGAAEPGCNLVLTVHLFHRLRQPKKVVGSLITPRQAAGAAGRRNGCGRQAGSPRAAGASWLTREMLSALGGPGRRKEPSLCGVVEASQPIPWLRSDHNLSWHCSLPPPPRPHPRPRPPPRPCPHPPPPRRCIACPAAPTQPRSPSSCSSCAVGHDGSTALGARRWLGTHPCTFMHA